MYVIIFAVYNMYLEILEYLKNNDGEFNKTLEGMLSGDEISYDVDDYSMHIDTIKHIMIRESDTYKYIFDFDNKVLKCILKDQSIDLDIDIEVVDMEMSKETIYIKYFLKPSNEDLIEYKLTCKIKN